MSAVALFLMIAFSGAVIAKRLLSFCRFEFKDGAEEIVFCAALGLGLWSYATFLLGSFGVLNRSLFIGASVALLTVFYKTLFETAKSLRQALWTQDRPSFFTIACITAVLVVIFLAFCGALSPPIGQDELCYHLVQPKNYVSAGRISEIPYSTNSLWPYFMEMLFTLGLLIQGPALAKLFHYATYLLTGLSIFCYCRRFYSNGSGWWGILIYLFTPAAVIQSAYAYVDNGLALYFFLSIYTLQLFINQGPRRWTILSGVFAGFTIGIKLIGIFIIPVAFVLFSVSLLTQKSGRRLFGALAGWIILLAICGGTWYLRSFMLRGNPVFPFFPEFFGGHGWHDSTYVNAHGQGKDLAAFLRLLWDLTMHPRLFGGEQVGPCYLIFVPLVLLLTKNIKALWIPLLTVVTYTFLWVMIDPNIRFFFPAVAFLAVLAGQGAEEWINLFKGWGSRAAKAALTGLFCGLALFAFYHFKDSLLVCFGKVSPASYLQRHERSYPVAQQINHFLAPDDRILSCGEIRGFYYRNAFTLEGDFYNMTHYSQGNVSAEQVVGLLKGKGFTHILCSNTSAELPTAGLEAMRIERLVGESIYQGKYFKEELIIHQGNRRYELYRIL